MDGHGRETFHFTRVCGVFSVNSISFHSAAPLTNMKHLMMHHVMKYYLRITLQHSFIWCPFSLLDIWRYLHFYWSHMIGEDTDLSVHWYIVHDCYDIWQQRLVHKNIMYHQNTTNKQKVPQICWWHNMIHVFARYLDLSCQVSVCCSALLTVAAV